MRILLILLFVCSVGHSQRIINSYSYAVAAPISIFPTGNAASPTPDEVDSTSGWSGASVSISSVETDSFNGISSMQATMSTGGSGRLERDVVVSNATTYDVSFYYRVSGGTGGVPGLLAWTGVTSSPSTVWNEDGLWHNEIVTVTTNLTTMKMRFYADRGTGTGTRTILVDNITIVAQ
jgi:hypothetical protein